MKVIVCPDVHQDLTTLRYCISQLRDGEVDKVVFLGDAVDAWSSEQWYTDSEHSPHVVIRALADWKKEFGDKFIWLIGNHDWAYTRLKDMRYSELNNAVSIIGHQYANHKLIGNTFDENDGMFDVAVCIDGIVYSHAGFTNTWLKSYIIHADYENKRPKSFMNIFNAYLADVPKFIDRLNKDFHDQKMEHRWLDHRSYSPIGDSEIEGPLWVRPWALVNDGAFQYQIVGHTEAFDHEVRWNKKHTRRVDLIDTPSHNLCMIVKDGDMEHYEIRVVRRDSAFDPISGKEIL